jgi:hypothetical protein
MNAFALAVIDAQIADCRASGDTGNVESLIEARDTFAELIEAVEATRATRGGIMGLGAQDARTVRLWNALARARGAA